MRLKRGSWRRSFSWAASPRFPCPKCRDGRLQLNKETLKHAYSNEMEQLDWSEHHPTEQVGRFVCLFVCDKPFCKEVVAVGGDYETEPFVRPDDDGYLVEDWASVLAPRSMVPAPPIIEIPKETPVDVRRPIEAAFGLFWGDRGAAANRLRTSVERALTHSGIPKGTLENRIKKFAVEFPDQGEKELNALRHVGNTGSHEGDLKWEVILDTFEVYEYWLRNFYGKERANIDALTDKLIKTKGRY